MGQFQGLTYTVSFPMSGNIHIPKGKRMDSVSGLFSMGAVKMYDISAHAGMQKQLKPHLPEIKKYVGEGRTVLVVHQFIEWPGRDGADSPREMLHYTYIAAVADTRKFAFDAHKHKQKQPLLKMGLPEGWVIGKEVYTWFEGEEKAATRNKKELGNLYWKSVK